MRNTILGIGIVLSLALTGCSPGGVAETRPTENAPAGPTDQAQAQNRAGTAERAGAASDADTINQSDRPGQTESADAVGQAPLKGTPTTGNTDHYATPAAAPTAR